MTAVQRSAHQPPRAHRKNYQNANDLAREAVGCMGMLARGFAYHYTYRDIAALFEDVYALNMLMLLAELLFTVLVFLYSARHVGWLAQRLGTTRAYWRRAVRGFDLRPAPIRR